jgi:hypothetical protein
MLKRWSHVVRSGAPRWNLLQQLEETVGTGRDWHFPTCPSGRAYQLSIVEAILLLAWRRLRLRPLVAGEKNDSNDPGWSSKVKSSITVKISMLDIFHTDGCPRTIPYYPLFPHNRTNPFSRHYRSRRVPNAKHLCNKWTPTDQNAWLLCQQRV